MKNKFIITLSDIHGSKQYTLSQFVKVVASWIFIVIIIALLIGGMIFYSLSNRVDGLKKTTNELKKEKIELKQEKDELKKAIGVQAETLQSMNEQLVEAEKLIGLDSKEDEANVSQTKVQENIEPEILDKSKTTLTKKEFKLLSVLIPNKKPLNYRRISTKFGFRIHPITKRRQFHPAVDLATDVGTPIYAPASGVVVYAGKKRFYGNFLLIRHGLGFSTAYGHLHRIGVKNGEYVRKGELVALSGNTGRSTGPHLHYEIRYLTKWLNPEPFMKEWSYKTYKDVMKKNHQVNWNELIKNLKEKINLIEEKKGE